MSSWLRVSIFYVCIGVLSSWCASPARAMEEESPAGRWQTFDDHTHQARGVVRIFEQDGRWFGRIERPGRKEEPRCTVCTDERKDQLIDGLIIIRNMQQVADDPAAWDGGDVLDPDTGRVYRLKMRLEDHGAKLVVRGFFGVSLLGRTQTWARLP